MFGDRLHAAGVAVSPERSGRFASALDLTCPATYDEVYWAARVTLLSDHDQLPVFDAVWRHTFGETADTIGGHRAPPPARRKRTKSDATDHTEQRPGADQAGVAGQASDGTGDDGPDDDRGGATLAMTASADEQLRRTDFAALTVEELDELRALMAAIRLAPPPRRRRRLRPTHHGHRLDMRSTIRRSHRTAGDPVQRVHRGHSTRPRRVVLIADVSGSMAPYARAYLQLLASAVGGARAEAFVFATQLTRLTRQLKMSNPTRALQRAAAATPDWSGGTRIGAALKVFNDGWGRRGLARGAVLVIVSDGWEADNADLVGEQMERLARLAHRIVWVNPRKQHHEYQPLVAGMQAALPYIDTFVSGHSFDAMQAVVTAISETDRPAAHVVRSR